MTDATGTVTIAHDVKAGADGIMDGREVARALIRQAMDLLSPYAEGCPVCTHALLSSIGFEVLQEDRGPRRIDAALHDDRIPITTEAMAEHVARARPSTVAMLDRHGQRHHREHLGEGVQLSDDEAETIERVGILTGRTAAAVIERVNRSPEDRQKFRVAVSLATDVWDYLDGETGLWTTNDDKQDRQLESYAATLFDDAPPPLNRSAGKPMSDYPVIRELILRARHDPSLSDEIDARTTAYLRGRAYDRHDHETDTKALRVWTGSGEPTLCPPYHRSRDALKTAHPPGWWFHEASRNRFRGEYLDGGALPLRRPLDSELCATPELAELMCVLMAWEVEREVPPYRKLRATEAGAAAYVIALDGNENGALMMVADQAGVPPQQLVQGLVNRSPLAALTACAEAVWSGFDLEADTAPPSEVSQALKDAMAAILDQLSSPMPVRPAS